VAIQILRDLRGLRVLVVHPPDNERVRLVEHLRRIGCMVETQWPVPDSWTGSSDVMLLAVEHDVRADIQRLLKSTDGPRPTLIAVVGYEDPSTLQLVLEAGAVAVIERPIRPFGLLTNLTIARSIWLESAKPKSASANWNASWPACSESRKPSRS
jgi:AmiR/NasT family two-component response regulator